MITTKRAGEYGLVPTRNHRFLKKDNYWYYRTREQIDMGPFTSRENASISALNFVCFVQSTAPGVVKLLGLYEPPTITNFLANNCNQRVLQLDH